MAAWYSEYPKRRILGELVVRRRARRLQAEGIDVTRLIEELTRLGDPLSIELLICSTMRKISKAFLDTHIE